MFCGSCAIESKVSGFKHKTINDKHEYLIHMFKELQNGWIPPNNLTKEEYYEVKSNKDNNKALTGFVGFACSFGGKWFRGYAKNNSGTNYAKQGVNSLNKKMIGLNKPDTTFSSLDYKDVKVGVSDVVYCDPPYANTTSYSNSNTFNHNDYWDYMRELSKSNMVFISEIKAPEDFISVWTKPLKRNLDKNKDNIFSSSEQLFIHKDNLEKYNTYIH